MPDHNECSQLSLRGKTSGPTPTVSERCPAYRENKDEPICGEYTSVSLVQDSKKIKQCNRKVESFVMCNQMFIKSQCSRHSGLKQYALCELEQDYKM